MASPGRLGSLVQHASAVALSYGEAPACWSWLLVVRGGIAAPGKDGDGRGNGRGGGSGGCVRCWKRRRKGGSEWISTGQSPTLFFFLCGTLPYPPPVDPGAVQRRLLGGFAIGLDRWLAEVRLAAGRVGSSGLKSSRSSQRASASAKGHRSDRQAGHHPPQLIPSPPRSPATTPPAAPPLLRRGLSHAGQKGYPIMDAAKDANPSCKLHTRLRLWEFADRYIFEPTDGLADLYLSVSRASGSMSLVEELPPRSPSTNPKVQTVYGVIGVLKLAVGSYFFVITDRDCVGSYLGHAIFKVTGLKVLRCNDSLNTSSEQKKMQSEISGLLDAAEKTMGLYFSHDINLTLNSQTLYDVDDEFKSRPLWRQAEPRFLWNSYLLEPLIENKLDQYLLPVIQGSFQNIQAEVGSEKVNVTLIARRCTERIGTRMWRRGADPEGYAANFVESEQIMQSKGYTASYVQVRGSMPFLWEQIVDLTYKPSFDVVRQEEAPSVLERHFKDLQKKYGAVLAVDLVNTQGGEGRLHEKYAKSIEPILSEDVRYVHFDFHRICGHVHFERLSQLYEQIEDYLKKHRYFLLNEKGEKIQEQVGTVRTNCIDCLDRTNVTQSMIGRRVLESQLQQIEVFGINDTITKYPAFDTSYKVLWANHGDAISIQYSGTPALKGDFVRYGERSAKGIFNDLQYSLARYYLNNFVDGTKQDAMDLLQGRYITSVSRDMAPPAKAGFVESYASARLAFALVSGAFIFMMMSLMHARHDARHLLLSLLWAGLCIGITHFVRSNGRVFTNRPRAHKSRP